MSSLNTAGSTRIHLPREGDRRPPDVQSLPTINLDACRRWVATSVSTALAVNTFQNVHQ